MTYEQWKTKYRIDLNDQQEQAVRATEGYVLLLAVPGSGKTTVLVTRLGYLLFGRGVPPEHILTMTYTVTATRDMRARFAGLFGEELADRLEFRTINGVSARIIRSYERTMGRKAFDLIHDEKELSALVGDAYRRVLGEFPAESDVKAMRTAITYAKNQMLSRDEIEAMDRDLKGFPGIYWEYDRVLKQQGRMDYDDQMVYAWQILRRHPEILRAFQARCRYLCVDEAQDTSKIQHKIIALLARGSGNLFLVGDEDQSIYGFRAAWPQALLEFDRVHPDARVLLMERNYRSAKSIVELADRFIQSSPDRRPKHMTAVREEGGAVREIALYDRKSQYSYLVKVARNCTRETAVLYRDNDCALPLIDRLEREGIPYRCRQMDGSFFTHRTTRDITDIIRLALDPADGETFLRIYYKFGAGITKAAAETAVRQGGARPVLEVLGEDGSLSPWSRKRCKGLQTHLNSLAGERADKAVYRILNFMGYGAYLQERGMDLNRAHILEALGEQEPTPARLLDRLEELKALVQDGAGERDCPFLLSTIHSSKGLEYERVFLMDVIDGILPKDGPEESGAEERRLFYVGMTRARDELSVFTFRKPGYSSAFAGEVFPKGNPPEKTAKKPLEVKKVTPKEQERARNLAKDFLPGQRVSHRQFGPGVLEAKQGDLATIVFDSGARKTISLSIAIQAGALERFFDE